MLSVVICTYNRSRLLARVLTDLEAQQVPSDLSWEVLVVDNNSHDNTRAVVFDFVSRARIKIRYLFEPQQGKSHALNTGIAAAESELIALTDDDVRVDSGWVAAIAHAFDTSGCDIVAGKIRATWEFRRPDWFVEHGPFRLMDAIVRFDLGDEPHWITQPPYGANMAVRKSQVLAAGGFRTDIGPLGNSLSKGEDTDLVKRLTEAGSKCYYAPYAVVDHPVEPHRARREYFVSWYYAHGRTQVLRGATARNARCIAGVPIYLLRLAAQSAARWALSLDRQRRFFYRLEFAELLGTIAQCYEIRSSHRQPSPPRRP